MAESGIRFEGQEWIAFLNLVTSNLKEPTKYLEAAFNTVGYRDILSHFDESKGPDSSWPPRAPSTNQMYDAIKAGTRNVPEGGRRGSFSSSNTLLRLSGDLRQSISPSRARVNRQNRSTIVITSPIKYSGFLDEGTGKMPARPFMWLSGRAEEQIGEIVLSYLLGDK